MDLTPVGLDVGTGYTKVSGGGRAVSFPTIYAQAYSGAVSRMEDMDVKTEGRMRISERVGDAAAGLDGRGEWTILRPVKHGMPYDHHGYSLVVRHAMDVMGIGPKDAVICSGVTYDARMHRGVVRNIILGMEPAACAVIPQAVGTLISCGRESGMVVNIGHGTTEIIDVGPGGVSGVSIPKASDFVLSQLAPSSLRAAYVHHERIFAENRRVLGKLVGLLAAGIADEVGRIGVPNEIVLAGGGSLIPGVQKALASATGCNISPVDDPLMSNAAGFEAKAAILAETVKKSG